MNKLAFASIALISALSASADLATTRIAPTTAYAPNNTGKEYARNAINGGGLSADGLSHSTGKEDATWRSDGAPSWFVMDLGKVYSVADIKIWNYNGSKATASGLKQIDILFSVDDDAYSAGVDYSNGKWTEVVTDIELAKSAGDGSNSYKGCDPIVLSTPKNARFIGFQIESTWGNVNGGLSEVRVDVVDETYSVALDGLSFDASQMSATFTGTMTAADGTGAEVFLAYGTEDAKMDLGTWENTVSCGTQASGDPFAKTISGLAADKTYYGALFVTNQSVASSWSETTNFITGVVSVRMPHDFCEAENFKRHIVFTRPASCAAEPLEISYAISGDAAADYASQLTETAVFAAGATEAAVELTPVKDTVSEESKTLTVTVQAGLYVTGETSVGSVTVLDSSKVEASNPSWTGYASTMDWDTLGNWSSLKVPNYLDTVTIDGNCSAADPVVASGDVAVNVLRVGSSAGSLGALRLTEGTAFQAASGATVGGSESTGTGYLYVDGGATLSSSEALTFGYSAGSTAYGTIAGSVSAGSGKDILFGSSGSAEVTVNGGKVTVNISGQSGAMYLGRYEGSSGKLVLNGSSAVEAGYTTLIGQEGYGELVVNDTATFHNGAKHGITLGFGSTGYGKVILNGGKVTAGSCDGRIGASGKGEVFIYGGEFNSRGVAIGYGTGGTGYVEVHEGGTISSGTTGYHFYVGQSGNGTLFMKGGRAKYSKNGSLEIRVNDGATGLLTGWGEVSASDTGAEIVNNGIVRADGLGEERTLNISTPKYYYKNTIQNDGTNGWYAVNKGLLSLKATGVSLDVTDDTTTTRSHTWGELPEDDVIDLVNSVRLVFTNVTTKISALTGKLYAPDRSDVPPLPSGKEAVGVWEFDINGVYASATVEFRYDHVKAPRGVQMYQRNADDTAWVKLGTELLEGYRAKVTVTDASRMFAARANHHGLTIVVR